MINAMNPLIWGFAAIVLILTGILFSRQDVKELGGKIDRLAEKIDRVQTDLTARIDRMQTDLAQFYRTLGQHDARIENLGKRQ